MRAIVYHQYGGPEVLVQEEIPMPTPKAHEMLVRVHASTVNAGTLVMRSGQHPDSKLFSFIIKLIAGWPKPRKKVLGYEFSGEVVAIGTKISKFKVGDAVYGTTTGLRQGAYADFVCVPERWKLGVVAHKPAAWSFEMAAALPVGAMTAVHLLEKAGLSAGQSVLVYGAGGSVGSAAVQLGKAAGAQVTAVCSLEKEALVKEWGASAHFDYKTVSVAEMGGQYDLIFDAVGKVSAKSLKSLLQPNGKFTSIRQITSEKAEYLQKLQLLVAAGQFEPHIDRVYPLEEAVTAHAYAETGRKAGNVVLKLF
ncbi:MAG: NAD(P)-dependent alcohol dehydrogenase [Sphingobacteriaceae bacterium]|nr:NAD(P)-dependent alcohol dehydrogenase [Sphingobacteriaceae bacterium]